MPAGDITVTVRWNTSPTSTSTYVIASGDASSLVKGDIYVKLHGKKDGESTAQDHEITRENTLDIAYATA